MKGGTQNGLTVLRSFRPWRPFITKRLMHHGCVAEIIRDAALVRAAVQKVTIKMHKLLKTAVIGVGLSGAMFATACTVVAPEQTRYPMNASVSSGYVDVAIGYRDG